MAHIKTKKTKTTSIYKQEDICYDCKRQNWPGFRFPLEYALFSVE